MKQIYHPLCTKTILNSYLHFKVLILFSTGLVEKFMMQQISSNTYNLLCLVGSTAWDLIMQVMLMQMIPTNTIQERKLLLFYLSKLLSFFSSVYLSFSLSVSLILKYLFLFLSAVISQLLQLLSNLSMLLFYIFLYPLLVSFFLNFHALSEC